MHQVLASVAPNAETWTTLADKTGMLLSRDYDWPGEISTLRAQTMLVVGDSALAGAGITRLDQGTQFIENEIKQLHGIGPDARAALRRSMKARGLSYAKKKGASQVAPASRVVYNVFKKEYL